MNRLKAIVVDDERLARIELISMLKGFRHIHVVAEADNVQSAKIEVEKHNPDVIFLDIQMPGKSGFDLLNLTNITAKVIFVTAFDEFAIRAFEINALDYLLKPVVLERLQLSIDRLEQNKNEDPDNLRLLNYNDHLLLNINSKLKFIRIDSILSITSAADYSNIIYADGKKGITLKTMKEWERRLPEKHFCRIHRSTIINIEKVIKIEPWYNHSHMVQINHIEKPFVMSRRYFTKVKGKLG